MLVSEHTKLVRSLCCVQDGCSRVSQDDRPHGFTCSPHDQVVAQRRPVKTGLTSDRRQPGDLDLRKGRSLRLKRSVYEAARAV